MVRNRLVAVVNMLKFNSHNRPKAEVAAAVKRAFNVRHKQRH